MTWEDICELQDRILKARNIFPRRHRPFEGTVIEGIEGMITKHFDFWTEHSLSDILVHLEDKHCQDPRDRIFGILRLIDWSRLGTPPLEPDYDLSRAQLAMRIVRYTYTDLVQPTAIITKILHVGFQDLWIDCESLDLIIPTSGETLREWKWMDRKCSDLNRSPSIEASGEWQLIDPPNVYSVAPTYTETLREWQCDVGGAGRIQRRADGQFAVDLEVFKSPWSGLEYPRFMERVKNRVRHDEGQFFGGEAPVKIYVSDDLWVLACRQTLSGDIIIETDEWSDDYGALVIRPLGGALEYRVVGRAIIPYGCRIRRRCDCYCKCWTAKDHTGSSKCVSLSLGFVISDKEAPFTGTLKADPIAGVSKVLDYYSLNMPTPGRVVRDVTAAHWGEDHFTCPFDQVCAVHSSLLRSRDALSFVADSRCGPSEWQTRPIEHLHLTIEDGQDEFRDSPDVLLSAPCIHLFVTLSSSQQAFFDCGLAHLCQRQMDTCRCSFAECRLIIEAFL